MQPSFGKNWTWIGLLVLLGLIPFLPYLFSGKLLLAIDAMAFPGYKFYLDALTSGTIALWNPYVLGGMPTFDALFGDASYPPFILLSMLLPLPKVVTALFIVETLVAGLGAWFLVRRFFGLDKLLSLCMGVAYMFNTNFFSYTYGGHIGKFHVMAWLPLSLFFLLRCLQPGCRWYHMLGLSLSVTLFISSSHLQFTYYVLMGYFLVWAFKSIGLLRNKAHGTALRTAGKFWAPVLLGVGLAFPVFYPPIQWNENYSVRGEGERTTYEHATSWSMHPEETASLLIPEFAGLNENYWGRNPFKLNSEYPGLSLLFLSAFGLAVFRRKWMWLWAGIGLAAVVFALGAHTPLFHLFYNFIPGIKNFRAPGMMIFWLATSLLMIAGHTLALLWKHGSPPLRSGKAPRRLLQIGLGISGAILLAGIFPGGIYGIWNAFVDPQAIPNFRNQASNFQDFSLGAIRTAVLLAVLTFALWKWVLRDTNRLRFSLVLLAVTYADLYAVNRHFLKSYEFPQAFPREPVVEAIKADTSDFRVFGLPGTGLDRGYTQYHRIETIEHFVDHEYGLYRALRGGDYTRNPNFFHGLQQTPDGSVHGSPFLDLLNVKYLLHRPREDGILRAVENTSRLPRGFLVYEWEQVPENRVLDRMKTPGFDPGTLAFVSPGDSVHVPAPPGEPGNGSVRILRRDLNRHEYAVTTDSPALLVLSELYFPFWNHEVNGIPVSQVRTNYAFRGIFLEPGSHRISAVYRSPWISLGLKVSMLSLISLCLLLVGHHLLSRRTERTAPWKP